MIVVGSVATNVTLIISVAVAVSRYKPTIQRVQRMSQNQNPLSSTEKRLAFYANLLENGKLKLTDEEAEEWRSFLPLAIEAQYFLLDKGELPVQMTLNNVRRLAEFEKRRDKTLDN
jgi:hypothetical protein